jgi:hypothetical protein
VHGFVTGGCTAGANQKIARFVQAIKEPIINPALFTWSGLDYDARFGRYCTG